MIRDLSTKVAPQLGTPVDGLFEQIEAIADIATPVGRRSTAATRATT